MSNPLTTEGLVQVFSENAEKMGGAPSCRTHWCCWWIGCSSSGTGKWLNRNRRYTAPVGLLGKSYELLYEGVIPASGLILTSSIFWNILVFVQTLIGMFFSFKGVQHISVRTNVNWYIFSFKGVQHISVRTNVNWYIFSFKGVQHICVRTNVNWYVFSFKGVQHISVRTNVNWYIFSFKGVQHITAVCIYSLTAGI